jgi:hypothetical protein
MLWRALGCGDPGRAGGRAAPPGGPADRITLLTGSATAVPLRTAVACVMRSLPAVMAHNSPREWPLIRRKLLEFRRAGAYDGSEWPNAVSGQCYCATAIRGQLTQLLSLSGSSCCTGLESFRKATGDGYLSGSVRRLVVMGSPSLLLGLNLAKLKNSAQ